MVEKLIAHVKEAEGFRERPYVCPAGKLTIGYGFNLADRGIPEEIADIWLKRALVVVINELEPDLQDFPNLSDERTAVLIDMAYNMGVPRLRMFKKMLQALATEDYEKAADEMLDSLWARQVGRRAVYLSKVMRTGIWP